MTYEQFKEEMQKLLTEGFKYNPNQAGFNVYSSKMADLAEKYPEYDDLLDNECA